MPGGRPGGVVAFSLFVSPEPLSSGNGVLRGSEVTSVLGSQPRGGVFGESARCPARPGRHDHRRPRLRRVGRAGRVHRRRHRSRSPAERRRHPGRRRDEPGRRRPGLLRHRRRRAGAQAHDRGAGPRRARTSTCGCSAPTTRTAIVEAFARSSADRKPAPGMALAAAEALDLDLRASWVVGDAPATSAWPRRSVRTRCTSGRPQLRIPTVAVLPGPRRRRGVHPGRRPAQGPARAVVDEQVSRSPHTASTRADAYGGAYSPSSSAPSAPSTSGRSHGPPSSSWRLPARRGGLRLRQWWLGVDRQPPAVRPRQGRAASAPTSPRGCTAVSTNVELLSAIANDLGYDAVFDYQLQSQARPGDVLIVVSSSGRSANIVRATGVGRRQRHRTPSRSPASTAARRASGDVSVHVDSANYGIVEDAHQSCMHLLAQYVRQSRMTPRRRRVGGLLTPCASPSTCSPTIRTTRRAPIGSGPGSSPRWPSG